MRKEDLMTDEQKAKSEKWKPHFRTSGRITACLDQVIRKSLNLAVKDVLAAMRNALGIEDGQEPVYFSRELELFRKLYKARAKIKVEKDMK